MFKYLLVISISLILLIPDLRGENVIHSVVTYNIKYDDKSNEQNSWTLRREGMIELINFISPDILGIQEGLLNQVDYLNTHLGNFTYVGVGRDDGNKNGEFCAIYFNKNTFRDF